MNDNVPPDIEFDDEAAALLAAFRNEEQIPAALHDRVWARVEEDVPAAAPVVVTGPWGRRVAIGALAAAAALALVWVSSGGLEATRDDDRSLQAAPHDAKLDRARGEATPGAATTSRTGVTPPRRSSVAPTADAPDPVAPLAEPIPAAEPPIESVPPTAEPARRDRTVPRKAVGGGAKTDTPAAPTAAPSESTLGKELALIERARKALNAGDHGGASAALREHAEQFPKGGMLQERRALAAITTCDRDGAQAGRARAEAFVHDYPNGALASRVRSACGVE